MSIETVPFTEYFDFAPKSKRKSGDGLEEGAYPFFVSSQTLIKRTNEPDYEGEALVFGTGGNPSVHYISGKFSTSGDCLVAFPKKNKEAARAINYFLRGNIHLLEEGFKGAGLKHISKKYISALEIPKLEELNVDNLAYVLDKAGGIRKKRRQAILELNTLLAASFIDMFGSPITNSKEMPTKKIKKIGKVVTGNTPSRKKTEYYGDHIEWIKSDNINTPYHYLTKADESLSEIGKSVGRVVPKGSILVTCIAGSKSCIGNSAMTNREVAFNQQINAIITNDKAIKTKFLYTQLFIAKGLVQKASTNSMKGMVSKSKFEEIDILCPPIEEQNMFETIFNEYYEAFERMNMALIESENIYKSLTQKAFEGAL
jgi:type I restriction enzyme S subunit